MNFCTLFDRNYLLKGLALHYSLEKHVKTYNLWILCMDDNTFEILSKLKLANVSLIRLEEFESKELKQVKLSRKKSEYCWTCTPFLPSYVLEKNPDLDMIAYLDADLFFYDSPESIYEEFRKSSIMIIPHNYSEDQKFREKISGIYNVGMLIFRNDNNAKECLSWWKEKVLDWCFDYPDNGRLGDQAYLNDWPRRFREVCVLKNEGANLASWNIKKYKLIFEMGQISVICKKTEQKWKLLFYHFHGTHLHKFLGKIVMRSENLDLNVARFIFSSYSETLTKAYKLVLKTDKNFSSGISENKNYLKWVIKKAVLQRLGNAALFIKSQFARIAER